MVTHCVLSSMQAVIWSSGDDDGQTAGGAWNAFSIPLELDESITAVDFAPVAISGDR